MRRILPFLLLISLAIQLLAACAPVYYDESSASEPSGDASIANESSQYDSVFDDMTFPDRYREILLDAYKGKTDEQLEAEFEYNPDNCSGICMAQSATSIYFLDGRLMRYDKVTGKAVPACADPLCDPQNCILSGSFFVAASKTKLFTARHMDDKIALCVTNADGTNPKIVYKAEIGEFMFPFILNEKICSLNVSLDSDGSTQTVLDMVDADGNFKRLIPPEKDMRMNIIGNDVYISGKTGIYRVKGDEFVRIYSGNALNVSAVCGGYIYFCRTSDEDMMRMPVDGGEAEEVERYPVGTIYRGYAYSLATRDDRTAITRTNIETMEKEDVFDLTGMAIGPNIFIDGDYLFLFLTDEYDVKKAEALSEKRGKKVDPKQHLAILDLKTGKRYILITDQ